MKTSLIKKGMYCQKCLIKEEVYKLEISGCLNTQKSTNWSTMFLTGDHKIMTQDGWKEIRYLNLKDNIKVPSWSNCKKCDKPTYYGKSFCYDTLEGLCSSSYHCQKTLTKGNHQSQKLDSRSKYLELLKKTNKDNRTEQRMEGYIKELGFTCESWNENTKADFIREFPVKVKSDGKYKIKTFFMDFYSPTLNLGIEVDGAAFHCEKRDNNRDSLIKQKINCDIIRIPAKSIWKKDFLSNTLTPILKNHSGEMKMLDFNSFKISRKVLKYGSSINRRWDITVKEGESFVCNKVLIHNSGFMDELLTGKSSRQGKNGRYAIIPFRQDKKPSEQTPLARHLTDQIKGFLKDKNIPYKKLEFNKDGTPKMGLLHKFDIVTGIFPSEKARTPALSGVSIYQRKNPATGKISRDIMTFRVISESMRSDGRWVHPGSQGVKIIDQAFSWAEQIWESEILPSVLESFK
jgi:very-short-patch-repair endonuclease